MFYTIYKTTNKVNNKYYIGKHQTKNLEDGYLGSGKLIRRAIKKHGQENFSKEILFVFDSEEEMNAKEKELVVVSEETYNLCDGGQGGFGYINKNNLWDTPQRKTAVKINFKKARETYLELVKTEPYKQMLRERIQKHLLPKIKENNVWIGRRHSDKTKKLMSKKASLKIGPKNSQFGTCWITNGILNKKINKVELSTYVYLGFKLGRI